ncbi:MAG: hypothetical protein IJE96_04065 [Mailhella sp.]|nr:hypothetical protein [Mailhella sp.]MBQ3172587.1 hypothetical protein [Mailhella sp.]
MKSVTFIDGVSQVHLINGNIRLDTFILQGKQGAEPVQEENAQLVLTPQGFLAMLGAMQQLAEKLTEAGLLQKQQ